MEKYYETTDDISKITFNWGMWLDIIDNQKSRLGCETSAGWVRMYPYELIDFLLKSDFLRQMGYVIKKIELEDKANASNNVNNVVNGSNK